MQTRSRLPLVTGPDSSLSWPLYVINPETMIQVIRPQLVFTIDAFTFSLSPSKLGEKKEPPFLSINVKPKLPCSRFPHMNILDPLILTSITNTVSKLSLPQSSTHLSKRRQSNCRVRIIGSFSLLFYVQPLLILNLLYSYSILLFGRLNLRELSRLGAGSVCLYSMLWVAVVNFFQVPFPGYLRAPIRTISERR